MEEEEQLEGIWKERLDMAERVEEQVRNNWTLTKESNILGKIASEKKSLFKSRKKLSKSVLDDGNLRHLESVVTVAKEYKGVTGLMRSFVLLSPLTNELYKHNVDIVAEGGSIWAKVISRTAKGVAMDWLTGASRTIVHQGEVYLEHASLFPHDFAVPTVIFHFINGVPDIVRTTLEKKGVQVKGNTIPLSSLCNAPSDLVEELIRKSEESDEMRRGEGEDSTGEREVSIGDSLRPSLSLPPVNLDVSSVFVLITNLTHPNGLNHKFDSGLLREQALMEMQNRAREDLLSQIEARQWIVCNTALQAIKSIVETVGGTDERRRWKELEGRLRIVKDDPSERVRSLEKSGKINDRAIKIFGTGDSLELVTASANKHFVQSAFHQGVHLAVILHQSRALSQQKELPL